MKPAESKYSTFDRELLAIYAAVHRFRPLIENTTLTIFTDHKPIAAAWKSHRTTNHSPRQERHFSYLAQFVSDIVHVAGHSNVVADTLSRNIEESDIISTSHVAIDSLDLADLIAAQENETFDKSGLKKVTLVEGSAWCELSENVPRPFVPLSLRRRVFTVMHGLGHYGRAATFRLISDRFYWPKMRKQISQWVQECLICQQQKVSRHTASHSMPFNIPCDRLQTIHLDIISVPPSVSSLTHHPTPCRYVLTMIDRYTRWVEAIPLMDQTAPCVAEAFVREWVSRYSAPLYVITDRGSNFESELIYEISELIGFLKIRTTAYHPQTNGLVERMHQTFKTILRTADRSWYDALPSALLALRIWPNENSTSPYELLTGLKPLVPRICLENQKLLSSHKLLEQLQEHFKSVKFTPPRMAPHSAYIPPSLSTCKRVWIRVDRPKRPLEAPYSGPYEVVQRDSKIFTVRRGDVTDTVAIDRLKPVHEPDQPIVINSPVSTSRSNFQQSPSIQRQTRSGQIYHRT